MTIDTGHRIPKQFNKFIKYFYKIGIMDINVEIEDSKKGLNTQQISRDRGRIERTCETGKEKSKLTQHLRTTLGAFGPDKVLPAHVVPVWFRTAATSSVLLRKMLIYPRTWKVESRVRGETQMY